MNHFYITMLNSVALHFTGKYRQDMETVEWHCYEDDAGCILYFYKPNIMYVKKTPNERNV